MTARHNFERYPAAAFAQLSGTAAPQLYDMTDSEIIALLAEALEVDESALTPDTEISSIEEWNSLGWLSVMSLLDERFDVSLSASEIRAMRTVSDVVEHVRSKSAVEN